MITEDYVSFETAKLLKEKGFPLPSTNFKDWVFCMYDENGYIQWGCYHPDYYCRVTLQMAVKWLREVHNIIISIAPQKDKYYFTPWQHWDSEWVRTKAMLPLYDTYEQACEAAIKYCLENLI